MMNNHEGFIENTAKDYDLDIETVENFYRKYWPETFYQELEEYIQYLDKHELR